MAKERRTFTKEFKKQIVQLHLSGKPRSEIIKEYELTPSAFDKWVRQHKTSGSFEEKDNRTPEQEELIRLRKENQRLMMENDIFKASRADNGTKVDVIRNNRHKYSISAMCAVLQLPRSTYYYEAKIRDNQDEELTALIVKIFKDSRNIYGQRKIKKELQKLGWQVSRRRIGRIMKEQGLVSKYTVAQFKPKKTTVNESEIGNVLNREFNQDKELKVVVSDLTYVRVKQKWHYICVLVDLYNREIIGYSAGPNKSAELVQRAFSSVKYNLNRLELFHTDRGSEFKNILIDATLETFGIARSLSDKGTPYDNAVAEATFKTIKTEFVKGMVFANQQELDLELFDYVNWFNHIRIHGSLEYMTPVEYKHRHRHTAKTSTV
ncbi:IS3 family transposase [Virgibacillus sp. 179-BFC.A HS]|uniref:IS3 family transposase n=1 Tax=Tigheibacillus jepli TaxID=3035914 RepID=A0ABU5CLC1_9BACI|nr:IS3 family transposase [Virgibacillus sp. 179-BFC.A HS]MDY0404845.1 IS3 family transposase [Virgibacillus sp. 179-BFC.A HS]MDY0405562.1 IS3 family transposase [Virgibacillus sp. 179-BFC.A HS]MDY0406611.1 IS3 family transposase [Virgibacillus sp. 179-BFC.A HS]MDY0407164.1 IS3 family transposase [Virgibacillus sp. 179-BFC.A HS]MDY0407214.1 IS3 family transposase [Virgibacillus sp. 179-BFC.A HS]